MNINENLKKKVKIIKNINKHISAPNNLQIAIIASFYIISDAI